MSKSTKITKPLTWSAEKSQVSELLLWDKNPRKISRTSFENLKGRIRARGFHDVIKTDGHKKVLSGNQRKKALVELDIKEVTILVPSRELTEEEKDKIALESNISDGEWDLDELRSFDVGTLADLNFQDDILNKLWEENSEVKNDDFDVDSEIKKIHKPKTQLGDLILLGPHKLICGDATDLSVLKRLFGNEKASLIYSDPPYNIKIDYNGGIGGKKNYGGNVLDNRSEVEYKDFLKKTMLAALSVGKDDLHIFYWNDQSNIWLVQTLYRELGLENKRVCLWIKNSQNPTPGVAFSKCFEPAIYGVRGKPYLAKNIQNLNEVMNQEITTGNNLLNEALDHLDLWFVKRLAGQNYEHATSKPPLLHHKAIRRCTKPGDIILDSFSGSASTLIAGEQLKRRVYAVELEPIFCDLAIRRYEALTGIKAKIIRNKHEEE